MPAIKTPPMIAPGVICPKCKGQMLDERLNKRTDKSPDYQCANLTCTDASGKYRTAIWLVKSTTANGAPPPQATPAETGEKPKLTQLYLDASEFVLNKVVPLYEKAQIGLTDTAVAAMVATLFISATKER